jgi:hypothetical protein
MNKNMKNSFGEEYGTNKYELYPRPTFSIVDLGNVYNPKEKVVINGSVSLDSYKNIVELEGLSAAKDAWWELYEWIMNERNEKRK